MRLMPDHLPMSFRPRPQDCPWSFWVKARVQQLTRPPTPLNAGQCPVLLSQGGWCPSGAAGALAGKCAQSPRHLAMSVGRTGVSKSLGVRPGPRPESAHGPMKCLCVEGKSNKSSQRSLSYSVMLGVTLSLSPSAGSLRTARSDKTRGAKGMVGWVVCA